MTKADYQIIAVALRESKKELISRGLIGAEVQEAARVLEEHLQLALLADNGRFDRKLFEQASYPYALENAGAAEHVSRYQRAVEAAREERRAYADELDDGDFPRMPLDPRDERHPPHPHFQHPVKGEYKK